MNEYVKGSHCTYCGTKFTEQVKWPRKCFRCYNDSFSNPLPGTAVIIPVSHYGHTGVLLQKRGINPHYGTWALTGGYMDAGETWQETAVRETWEEVGLKANVEDLVLHDVCKSTTSTNIVICGYYNKVFSMSDIHFEPNPEVLDIKVVLQPEELGFSLQTEFLETYFNKLRK